MTEELLQTSIIKQLRTMGMVHSDFLVYEQDHDLKKTLESITHAWIEKFRTLEWSIVQLDNISFLEATTAKSRNTIQHSRIGIAQDVTLCGYHQKIKEAKNTLGILIWDWQTDKRVADALRQSVDASITVVPASQTLTRAIEWPYKVIGPTR